MGGKGNTDPDQGNADPSGEPSAGAVGGGFQGSTGYLLVRLGAESRRRWSRMLAEYGLAPQHVGVLMALDHLGPTYQQRLSEAVGVDPRNAVPVIDALEQRTLVRRRSDTVDRRRRQVSLTEEGRSLVRELWRRVEDAERDMLAVLAPDDHAALHRLLRTLFDAMLAPSAHP